MKKYRVYRIFIQGVTSLKCSIETDNIEELRLSTAKENGVEPSKVKFNYDSDQEWKEAG